MTLRPVLSLLICASALCSCVSPAQMPTPSPTKQTPQTWQAFDGDNFAYTKWLPKDNADPKAVIIGVHGLSGAADDYRPMGQFMETKNKAVYSYELRGMGNDPVERRRGDIKSQQQWFDDLNTFIDFVRRNHPNKPLFLYGESLGSLIVMHSQLTLSPENKAAISGVILASPIVAFREPLPPIKDFVLHLLIKVFPWMRISVSTLAGEEVQVTSDTTHESQMAVTPHFVERFTFRILGKIEQMIHGCGDAASCIEKPLLILYPGKDYFTDAKDVESFFENLKQEDKTKHLYPESYHLLLHDKDSNEVLETLDKWLEEKAP